LLPCFNQVLDFARHHVDGPRRVSPPPPRPEGKPPEIPRGGASLKEVARELGLTAERGRQIEILEQRIRMDVKCKMHPDLLRPRRQDLEELRQALARYEGTEVEEARRRVSAAHPDHGGTEADFIAAKRALAAAKRRKEAGC
jgi:hypothetical protein